MKEEKNQPGLNDYNTRWIIDRINSAVVFGASGISRAEFDGYLTALFDSELIGFTQRELLEKEFKKAAYLYEIGKPHNHQEWLEEMVKIVNKILKGNYENIK